MEVTLNCSGLSYPWKYNWVDMRRNLIIGSMFGNNFFAIGYKGKVVYTCVDPHLPSLVGERFAQ